MNFFLISSASVSLDRLIPFLLCQIPEPKWTGYSFPCLWLTTPNLGALHPGFKQRKGHEARVTETKPPVLSKIFYILPDSMALNFQVLSHRPQTQTGITRSHPWFITFPLGRSPIPGLGVSADETMIRNLIFSS